MEKNQFGIGDSRAIVVMALYKFVYLPDYTNLKEPLLKKCQDNNLYGTVLLAEEGINGALSGSRDGLVNLLNYLQEDERFSNIEFKESTAHQTPFHRMKVKLKKEIVSMGLDDVQPGIITGTGVEPRDWNNIISDPDVLVIDTRNQYEIDIGSFKNATSSGTETFSEFPGYVADNLNPDKQKKIAMYCTGGIRCEKASAYLLKQGFEEVFQLNGGILKYLEEVEREDSLWEGECFVFDGRVAVDCELKPGQYAQCYACRRPVSPEQMKSGKYEEGVSCPHCFGSLSEKKHAAVTERQKQVKLAEHRKQLHIGASMPIKKSLNEDW
jgi:UPF0176 protein